MQAVEPCPVKDYRLSKKTIDDSDSYTSVSGRGRRFELAQQKIRARRARLHGQATFPKASCVRSGFSKPPEDENLDRGDDEDMTRTTTVAKGGGEDENLDRGDEEDRTRTTMVAKGGSCGYGLWRHMRFSNEESIESIGQTPLRQG